MANIKIFPTQMKKELFVDFLGSYMPRKTFRLLSFIIALLGFFLTAILTASISSGLVFVVLVVIGAMLIDSSAKPWETPSQ